MTHTDRKETHTKYFNFFFKSLLMREPIRHYNQFKGPNQRTQTDKDWGY